MGQLLVPLGEECASRMFRAAALQSCCKKDILGKTGTIFDEI